jgi:hypothetical protein
MHIPIPTKTSAQLFVLAPSSLSRICCSIKSQKTTICPSSLPLAAVQWFLLTSHIFATTVVPFFLLVSFFRILTITLATSKERAVCA